jgi:uncharacterized protein (TIGR03790 family)
MIRPALRVASPDLAVALFRGFWYSIMKMSPLCRLLLGMLCLAGLGLSPSQIALIVNKNAPDGLKLAQTYAAARGIPQGHIITLDLPTGDEITFDQYERDVVPPVRAFLRSTHLDREIRCLVTFWGVPLRIRAKTDTDAEKQELADLQNQLIAVTQQVEPQVDQLEKLAIRLDENYRPPPIVADESDVTHDARRALAAMNAVSDQVNSMKDLLIRHQVAQEMTELLVRLDGPAGLLERLGPAELSDPNKSAEQRQRWIDLRDQILQANADLMRQERVRYDPDARARVRRVAGQFFGPLKLATILENQIDYLKPGTTNAALDNELALLWLNYYPRNGPWINPLSYKSPLRAPVLMVSRLDGPDVPTVAKMIQTSINVERDGLHGITAINSFGYPKGAAANGRNLYREFDWHLRDLARMIRSRSAMDVHEEYTHLFHQREVKDVALYCGWYSLRHYEPGMNFAPGAVGYHVASLEMVGLHGPLEQGWVHGLLSDGVVATLGPVAEPYLGTFPPPEEFFPLLMTGKLTLAEVYWKTEPATSWMICLVGDPLYTPFKTNPAMKVEDLPASLQTIFAAPAAGPNSSLRLQ